jgi:hypothetical protein
MSAKLGVATARDGPNAETLHGEALEKIAYLEHRHASAAGRPRLGPEDEEDAAGGPPQFVVKLQGKTQLMEGQNAHAECRIEPYPDQTLRVEWFHNGKPLPFGNRWRTSYGEASLQVSLNYTLTYELMALQTLDSPPSTSSVPTPRTPAVTLLELPTLSAPPNRAWKFAFNVSILFLPKRYLCV